MPFYVVYMSLYISNPEDLSKGRPFTVRGDLDGRQILSTVVCRKAKNEYVQVVCSWFVLRSLSLSN